MALTVSIPAPVANGVPGVYSAMTAKYALVIGDIAYPQGGYPVTPGTFGFTQTVQSVRVLAQSEIPSGWFPVYDSAFNKLRFLQLPSTPTGPMNEAVTGTNLSSVQVTVQALGW